MYSILVNQKILGEKIGVILVTSKSREELVESMTMEQQSFLPSKPAVLPITFLLAKRPQLHQTATLVSFLVQLLEHMNFILLVLMEYSAILLVYAIMGDVWLKE